MFIELKTSNVKMFKERQNITMHKTQRRCKFNTESKNRWKHNRKVFLIAFRKKNKDIVKLNVLKCVGKIAMGILTSEIRKNEICPELFFINLDP